MTQTENRGPQRILIASSHPLFSQGIISLLDRRQEMDTEVVGIVSSIDEVLQAIEKLQPDLVVVDYDDERVNREEFLARYVEGESRLRVVLFSLKEGGDQAIVYDRRTMAASQIDDWLEGWSGGQAAAVESPVEPGPSPDKPKRRESMRHFIVAAVLVILLAVGTYFLLDSIQLLPEQASEQAKSIDQLFRLDFTVISILFALIIGLMVYSFIFFRRRKGDDSDGPHIEGNTGLEVVWTLIPLGFVLFLAFYGSAILGEVETPDPQPLRVDVFGSQWSWRFEYPDYDIISTVLVLPVDKQALLNMTSTDVIHSFWIPEFRVKQDLLPGDGFEKELRITPVEEGEYKVRCAELCGQDHYKMLADVEVLSAADFEAWITEQTVSDDPVVRGEQGSKNYGCTACHSSDGSELPGPTWQGIFGSTVSLTDGTTVTVDRAYIIKSIREPGAQIVEGYENIKMPEGIGAELTDEQIDDLVAYIESLQ